MPKWAEHREAPERAQLLHKAGKLCEDYLTWNAGACILYVQYTVLPGKFTVGVKFQKVGQENILVVKRICPST